MRGFLLLLLGASLIWLGAKTSRSEAGEPDEGGTVESSLDEDVDLSLIAVSEPPGESFQDPVDGLPDDAVGDPRPDDPAVTVAESVERPVAAGSDDVPEAVEFVEPRDSGPRAPEPQQPQTPAPAPGEPVVLGPPQSAEERGEQDGGRKVPSFELGAPGGGTSHLAELLLEAWIARDPGGLQGWLNDEANEIPLARRRLVASFWQAAAGSGEGAHEEAKELEGEDGVTTPELELLRAAADPEPDRPVPAAIGRRDPLARAMRMVLLEQRAEQALQRGEYALAARSASDLIQLELVAPWKPHRAALLDWADLLARAQAHHRLSVDGDWPGDELLVKPGDTLTDLRQAFLKAHPGNVTCVGLIRAVNGVKKYIHPGDVLRVPTDPANVLVDLDARLCVYRHGSEAVLAWEVGIGMEGMETPIGTFVVGEKQPNPSWMPHGGEQLPFGHPDNPLGTRWIAWFLAGEKTSYGMHGTWEPDGVGGRVSRGCVRMRNEDVEVLYELLPVGARVTVQD